MSTFHAPHRRHPGARPGSLTALHRVGAQAEGAGRESGSMKRMAAAARRLENPAATGGGDRGEGGGGGGT